MKAVTIEIAADNPILGKVAEVAKMLGISSTLGMHYLTEGVVKAVLTEYKKGE